MLRKYSNCVYITHTPKHHDVVTDKAAVESASKAASGISGAASQCHHQPGVSQAGMHNTIALFKTRQLTFQNRKHLSGEE